MSLLVDKCVILELTLTCNHILKKELWKRTQGWRIHYVENVYPIAVGKVQLVLIQMLGTQNRITLIVATTKRLDLVVLNFITL